MTARVLVVGNAADHAKLLQARLAAEYYQMANVPTGIEALRLTGEWHPDIILLGAMPSGMDGFEVCRRLKADPAMSNIPVVMILSRSKTAERMHGLEAGADDFLNEPIEFDTLLARLRGLVRLRRLLDEWQMRAKTARLLGLTGGSEEPPTTTGTRVLVVSDQEFEARNLAACLAREGLISTIARNEVEMQAATAMSGFDLIVLNPPLADGVSRDLASRLRASERTQDIPLLLLADPDEGVARGFDLGANDWLLRPVEGSELRARARNQIRRRLYQRRLRAGLDQALALVLSDPLTGLYNQRYILHHLRNLLEAAPGRSLAVLMIDVDHFKRINDNYGHLTGDRALKVVAETLRANLRVFDTLARYGGEEFVVVMPGASLGEATGAGERLRDAVAEMRFQPHGRGRPHRITVSIGVAANLDLSATPEMLLEVADRALSCAKRGGRNRVEVARAD